MKKILSLILSLSILLSMATVTAVFAEDEVIFSDSFENGMDNWVYNSSKCNDTNTTPTTAKATDGKTSVYVYDADGSTYGYKSVAFPAEAGRTYTVSYDQFNEEGCGAKIFTAFFDDSEKRISSTSFGDSATGEWKSLSKEFVAPAGATGIVLYITGSGAGTGKTYIDNVKIVYNKDIPAQAQTESVSSATNTNVAAGDTVFSESFESGIDAWALKGDGCTLSTDKATDGKNSIYVVDESDSLSISASSAYIPVKPHMSYTASADFIDAEGTVKIYLKYLGADEKQISSTSASTKQGSYTGKVTVAAPDDVAYAQIVISSNSTTLGKAYVDNVKLVASEATTDEKAASVIAEVNAKIAAAKPGDTIIIPNGTYKGVKVVFTAQGTEAAPITLKAETPGKVIFTGESTVRVTGSYLVTEGLLFEGVTTKFIFVFEAATDHCQIKECAFINCDPVDASGKIDAAGQQKWVYIRGTYNKVSNCYFRGKTALGMMAEIIRTEATPDYHVIENSYFGDFKEASANGLETIRIGTSTQSLSSSYSTVQGCFFESCNGEVETISVKSCNNYILNNTLYNNKGAIVLRHGNGTEVRGNLVIGGDATTRASGVRIIGEDHKVYNNYFYNTPANSSVLYLSDGNPNPLIHEYLEVKNADVHNNTFVQSDTAIVAGEYAPSDTNASNKIIPPSGKIYNNAIISYKGINPLITGDTNATGITFENNYAYGKEINYNGGLPSGITVEKFDYTVKDSFVVPANGTGADISDVSKAPKSPYDVMPQWVKEQYYDTGKIKFNIVANDPFNNPNDKIEDLFPQEGKISVVLNGNAMKFDVEPQLINSRTMVPMRAIFEAFGAEVLWDEATASATASNILTTIKITENSTTAYVNGKEYTLDSPAVIIDGRFLVPVRFISESFGASVDWNELTQTVNIDYTTNAFAGEFKNQYDDIANGLTVYAAIQSGDDGSANIKNIFDKNTASKWAVKPDEEGNPGYGIFDLGSVKTLDKLYMSFQASADRVYTFEIYASEDGVNYTLVVDKTSTTKNDGTFEIYDLKSAKARYVKYVGYGNNQNTWNNISELVITGQ